MGRLMGKLKDWDLYKDTILIFMSDNGMTGGGSGRLGQAVAKGYPFFNAGMKGLKGSADEGGVRVPFFIRWDDHWKAGRNIATVSAHIDLLPTLAAIAGIKKLPEEQVEGRSMLPLLTGEKKTLSDSRYLFTHKGRWKTGAEPNDFQWINYAVRNQRYRFVGGGTAISVSERQRKKGVSPKRAEQSKLFGTPPIKKPGFIPAYSRIQASMLLVVVFPCVPAAASTHLPGNT